MHPPHAGKKLQLAGLFQLLLDPAAIQVAVAARATPAPPSMASTAAAAEKLRTGSLVTKR
jgi:hypothetical protein